MISGGLPCSDGNLRGAPRRSLSRIAAARIARGKQQKNVCTRRPIKMLEGTAACFYIYIPPPHGVAKNKMTRGYGNVRVWR